MWEAIRANKRKSVILIFFMALLFGALGVVIGEAFSPGGGGAFGILVALGLWAVLNLVAYFQGSAILLFASGARKIEKNDAPQLWNVTEEMTIASGLPKMPDIYIIEDMGLNAFATGRDPNHAAVAVTAGLLGALNRDQLQGVIAHEIAHIKNRDILFMTLMGTTLGAIVIVSQFYLRTMFYSSLGGGGRYAGSRRGGSGGGGAQLVMMLIALVLAILSPILAQIIYYAASRQREYLADASGALYTRYPEGLAQALEVISRHGAKVEKATSATAPMYIINPMMEAFGGAMFSTHPPTQERINILRSMGSSPTYQSYQKAWEKVDGKAAGRLPASALAMVAPAAVAQVREPSAPEPLQAKRHRMREAGDRVRKAQGFTVINCGCGLRLKVPPDYHQNRVKCPKCGTFHNLPSR